MPAEDQEGRLRFTFPEKWVVLRLEKSAYYSRHFQRFCGGCKETDFTLWDPGSRTLWLLEVKDYRTNQREKPENVFDEIARKTRDTLAFLASAAASAQEDAAGTKSFSLGCLPADSIRVVLHLERPANKSRLHPPIKFAGDETQELRRRLRCIDCRAIVISSQVSAKVPWKAAWTG
jgi:hypothetical protein